MGLPPRARSRHRGVRGVVPRRLHLRGDRPDARLVLHADGRGGAALRRDRVPQRGVPRPPDRRGRPQDVEVARQQVRSVGGARPPGRRRPALVDAHERLPLGVPPDRARDPRRARAPVPAAAVERLRVLRDVRERERGRRRRGRTRPATDPMDRWILSQLAGTVARRPRADGGLRRDRPRGAGSRRFVDDLSTWYVRRSRRRFWNPGAGGDADSERSVRDAAPVPRHPERSSSRRSRRSSPKRSGATSRRGAWDAPTPCTCPTSPTGRGARSIPGSTTRWRRRARSSSSAGACVPRRRCGRVSRSPRPWCTSRGTTPALEDLLPIVAEELNVHDVRLATSDDAFGTWRAKPDFKVLGPRLGSRVKALAAALAERRRDPRRDASRPAARSTIDDRRRAAVVDRPDDVELAQEVLEGWGVASDGGVTVALELELTPELRSEGLARELVRVVQDARRTAGLAVQRPDRPRVSTRPASSPTRRMHTRRSSRARRSRPSYGPILQRTRTRR